MPSIRFGRSGRTEYVLLGKEKASAPFLPAELFSTTEKLGVDDEDVSIFEFPSSQQASDDGELSGLLSDGNNVRLSQRRPKEEQEKINTEVMENIQKMLVQQAEIRKSIELQRQVSLAQEPATAAAPGTPYAKSPLRSASSTIDSPAAFPCSQRYSMKQSCGQQTRSLTTNHDNNKCGNNSNRSRKSSGKPKPPQTKPPRPPLITPKFSPHLPRWLHTEHASTTTSSKRQNLSPYQCVGAEWEVESTSPCVNEDQPVDVEALTPSSQCSEGSFTGSQAWVCGSQQRRSSQFRVPYKTSGTAKSTASEE